MPRPGRLLAPDVGRMAEIEQQLAALTPRLSELEAGRAVEGPAFALRDEWLQLQVVRSFLPRCAMCDEAVGPAYLELGRDGSPPALCLNCLDSWACDHDPGSGHRPPSHWVALTAQEARELEAARRQESGDTPPDASSDRLCWHCGGPVDDLGGLEATYAGDGNVPPRVVLMVVAVVPAGTSPELGEVCLPCLDRDLELFGRWKGIERDLCDPARRQHERALHRFVQDGPPHGRPEVRGRSRTAASASPQPASPQAPQVRRTAGR